MSIKEYNQWFAETINRDRKNNSKKEEEVKELLYNFVDNCPSKKGPDDCSNFSDYGFKNSYDYSKYKKRIFKAIPLLKDNYYYLKSSKELYNYANYISSKYSDKKTPFTCFAKGEFGEIDSLFIRIRNAFAHGNYYKKDEYYIIWGIKVNKKTDEKTLTCFMKLKYSQLIKIFKELKSKD